MSSIGSPPKRVGPHLEVSTSKAHAEALAQRQIDDAANSALLDGHASGYESSGELRLKGTLGSEGLTAELGLEPPGQFGEGHAHIADEHIPQQLREESTLANRLEQAMAVLNPSPRGARAMPPKEAAEAQMLMQGGAAASAARTRSLQQNQASFIIPLTLRSPRRTAYTEKPGQQAGQPWDVEAIEALIGTLHVSVGGGLQTHDDPALRKERRFRRWLLMLAHRRRAARRKGKQRQR